MMTAEVQGVRCGNKKAHGDDRVYHPSTDAVRLCYQGRLNVSSVITPTQFAESSEIARSADRAVSQKPAPLQARWDSIPVGGKGYGYYALDVVGDNRAIKFFRVERPTKGQWAGKTFIKEQAGDSFFPIEPRQRGYTYLTQIAADPEAAGRLYAKALDKCTRCGRTLTDPESRERSMGPDCFAKGGW